jgi:alkylhydroperoxidase family enzyme
MPLCHYAIFFDARQLIDNKLRADEIFVALSIGRPKDAFWGKELAFLNYTRKLTVSTNRMEEAHIKALRDAGADDENILKVNQVSARFNCSTRVLKGPGDDFS